MSVNFLLTNQTITTNLKVEEKFVSATKIPEQRRYQRIEIPEAIVVTPGNIGQLVNISTVGLSFKSLDRVNLPTKWFLDIIIPANDFHLEQLPVELVWKKLDDHPSFLSMPTENVGVRFDDLHQSQRTMLDYLFSQFFR